MKPYCKFLSKKLRLINCITAYKSELMGNGKCKMINVKQYFRQWYLECQSFFLKFRLNKKSKITVNDAVEILNSVYSFCQKIKQTTVLIERKNQAKHEGCALTIITCVFNTEENLLRACLDSLLKQNTQYDYEVILVDDGSRDNTVNILKEYVKNNSIFKLFVQSENGGAAKARNKGLQYARGNYITFVDSDDCIDVCFVEKMLGKALAEGYDIVKCGYRKEKKGVLTEHIKPIANYMCKNSFVLNYDGFMCGAIYKKEFFNNIQLPENSNFEDMIVRFILYRKAESFYYLAEPLYHYNDYSTNTTNGASKTNMNRLDQICLLEAILRDSQKLNIVFDNIEISLVLHELGFISWYRLAHLPMNIRECAFVYAAENIVRKYLKNVSFSSLTKREKQIYKCFKDCDFKQWLVIGRMQ